MLNRFDEIDYLILKVLSEKGVMQSGDIFEEIRKVLKNVRYTRVMYHIRKLKKGGLLQTEGRGKLAKIRITERGGTLLRVVEDLSLAVIP